MIPIVRQTINQNELVIVRQDGAVFSYTRAQITALIQQLNRPQAIDQIRSELGAFLDIDPSVLTNKVLFNIAAGTGDLSLVLESDNNGA